MQAKAGAFFRGDAPCGGSVLARQAGRGGGENGARQKRAAQKRLCRPVSFLRQKKSRDLSSQAKVEFFGKPDRYGFYSIICQIDAAVNPSRSAGQGKLSPIAQTPLQAHGACERRPAKAWLPFAAALSGKALRYRRARQKAAGIRPGKDTVRRPAVQHRIPCIKPFSSARGKAQSQGETKPWRSAAASYVCEKGMRTVLFTAYCMPPVCRLHCPVLSSQ